MRMRLRSAGAMWGAVVLVLTVAMAGPGGATVGPTNNFGTSSGSSDSMGVRLADSAIQEYSLWPNYMGWNSSEKLFVRTMMIDAVENVFEPSDLTVTSAADNSDQDVRFVPVPVPDSNPGLYARVTCVTEIAAIYGSHHHRVCDRKQVTLYEPWLEMDFDDQMRTLSHEFGHQVGVRHSNSPCGDLATICIGTSATGVHQWNSFTPTPGTASLMYSDPAAPGVSSSLSWYDYANINAHY